jgi:uncharacterized protein YecT (DUF1311 family)
MPDAGSGAPGATPPDNGIMRRLWPMVWMCWLVAAQPARLAERSEWQAQAKAAFDREMARQNAGDCRGATTTLEINQCLSAETAATKANYDTFLSALRSLVGYGRTDTPEPPGATGRPLTRSELLTEFDSVETAWGKYREAQCQAAYDQYKGGSIAPSQAGFCELRLRHSRMQELHAIYEIQLVN